MFLDENAVQNLQGFFTCVVNDMIIRASAEQFILPDLLAPNGFHQTVKTPETARQQCHDEIAFLQNPSGVTGQRERKQRRSHAFFNFL